MTSEFKTYEKKYARVCGECEHRFPLSGFCILENDEVRKGDPACKHFKKREGK